MTSQLPLVDYSSSSDSDVDSAAPPPKLRKLSSTPLPPLPSKFRDLYAVNPRIGKEDDPSLHGGRKRSIPHVQGNWPTHVFVEWHLSRAEFDCLDSFYKRAVSAAGLSCKLESHLKSDLGAELPLHLSLSAPNVLRTEQREGFLETLQERLRKARVKPFIVEFTGFEWVGNYERTRWFLILKVRVGEKQELPRLLDLTNRTFAAFGQPTLYASNGDSSKGFHVSLAWSLTKPSKEVEKKVYDALDVTGGTISLDGGEQKLQMAVDSIKVKIGNVLHMVELGEAQSSGGDASENHRKRRMS